MERYIHPLRNAARLRCIGAKAASLQWLLRHGFPVPETWVCCWKANEMRRSGAGVLRERLEAELEAIIDPRRRYAVRSSANLEDGAEISFAGQFTSVLDVKGLPQVLAAIEAVFSSTENPKVHTYLEAHRIPPEKLRMGVIIQQMVEPEVSGVCFSRNPMTGLDEVVVEAVEGRGDLLLEEGHNPCRWIHKWGTFVQAPASGSIDPTLIESIVRRTRRIEKKLGKPVDVEWVFGGGSQYLVQVRPLGQIANLNVYSNRISREFLPGQIKPLVWSINVPLVNGAWIDLFHRLIGPTTLRPEQLAKTFYHRAYFNMGAVGTIFHKLGFPRESLELLMGIEGGEEKPRMRPSLKSIRYLPRLLWFLGTKLWYGRTVKRAVQRADAEYRRLLQIPLTELGDGQLLERVDRLFDINRRLAFHNIVAPLFMSLFSRLLQRKFDKSGLDYEQFDLKAGVEELARYDPNPKLALLRKRFAALPEETRAAVRSGTYRQLLRLAGEEGFRDELAGFITHFGHLSDSGNDFSSIPWRENPDMVLRMICDFQEAREGENRTDGQPAFSTSLARAIARARRLLTLKEAVSFTYTYGYGLFRTLFLHLGDRWVKNGLLDHREDILYLDLGEVRALGSGSPPARPPRHLVRRRRAAMEASRDVQLPEIIYGDEEPSVHAFNAAADRLRGTATSRGYYTGPATVIRSVGDFSKLNAGDVLVITHSDVAWTALFSKAGAVVSEAGGLLSHSSIVAREYQIPCVVGVAGATALTDGKTVAVDGYRGSVHILKEEK